VSNKVKPTIVAPSAGGVLQAAAAAEAGRRKQEGASRLAGAAAGQGEAAEPTGVAVFRPGRRPPVALLTVLDDGANDGEVVRLRDARTVVGREDADVRIPHDPLISSKHLEIVRRAEGNSWRWAVRDLGSRNGTFFRVSRCRVRNQFEFLMGSCRYRLNVPNETVSDADADREDAGTQGWAAVSLESLAKASAPHLVRFEGDAEVASYPLGEEMVIGSDPAKSQITVDDPLLNSEHARLIRQPNGMWRIEDLRSRNGTWMRIEQSAVERGCQFQLGEQRFLLKVN